MYAFHVTLTACSASFREPSSHLYQKTLPLPPVSAMAGLAGAALGLPYAEVWNYFKNYKISVGVAGASQGQAIDLWQYQKMVTPKGTAEKEGTAALELTKAMRHDILNREFLAYLTCTLCYGCEEHEVAKKLHDAFANPKYALSLGTSDDIAKIKFLSPMARLDSSETINVSNALVPGDAGENVSFDWEKLSKSSASQTLRAPAVGSLIVDFAFDAEKRSPKAYAPFTFLHGNQLLKSPIAAYRFGELNVPMYRIGTI